MCATPLGWCARVCLVCTGPFGFEVGLTPALYYSGVAIAGRLQGKRAAPTKRHRKVLLASCEGGVMSL